jgi:hypothetical protein
LLAERRVAIRLTSAGDPAGRSWQPYALANVWRNFAASATTLSCPDPVLLLEQATRLGLSL